MLFFKVITIICVLILGQFYLLKSNLQQKSNLKDNLEENRNVVDILELDNSSHIPMIVVKYNLTVPTY